MNWLRRIALGWGVYRHGLPPLPVAEVKMWLEAPDEIRVSFDYAGRAHGYFDGDFWSDNGIFTVRVGHQLFDPQNQVPAA